MTNRKGGKPKIHIDIERVEQLAARGLSNTDIAAALGIGRTTLQYKKKESEQLEQAITRARARSVAMVSDRFFEIINAKDGDDYKFGEDARLNAMKFFLERRGGWTRESKIITSEEEEQPMHVTIELVDASKDEDSE